MIKLNEVSKSIVEKLIEKDMSIDELYDAMLSEYDVDRETLEKSVPPIIEQLKSVKIVK